MKTTTSARPETLERQDRDGVRLPALSADSGCWQHVQWPLHPDAAGGRPRFRGSVGAIGRVRKLLASRPGADLPLQPGGAR